MIFLFGGVVSFEGFLGYACLLSFMDLDISFLGWYGREVEWEGKRKRGGEGKGKRGERRQKWREQTWEWRVPWKGRTARVQGLHFSYSSQWVVTVNIHLAGFPFEVFMFLIDCWNWYCNAYLRNSFFLIIWMIP